MSDNENPVSEGEAKGEVEAKEVESNTEEVVNETVEEQQERQVPLKALEAERRKRQEAEAENRLYQQHLSQPQQPAAPEEDDGDDWVTKKEYRKSVKSELYQTKREILEEAFVQSNPDAYKQINDDLPELIKQKPWVKEVIENAPNRWQRASELVKDLYHKPELVKKSQAAQKVVENAQKPGSPTTVGKSATSSKVDYMRSIRGTPEWDQYRAKLRRGES